MLNTAMRLETFGFDGGCIEGVFLIIFDVSDLALKLGPVNGGPAIEEKDLIVLGVVVGGGIGLMGDSEEV